MIPIIQSFEFWTVRVSPQTCWSFVRLTTPEGLAGMGEATLNGREAVMAQFAGALASGLIDKPIRPLQLAIPLDWQSPLPLAAVASAVAQAQVDIAAQSQRQSFGDFLGPRRRSTIPLYANINRRTRDRSPSGFAASAREALERKFSSIKIAPFDEVSAETLRDGPGVLDGGFERIEAVRQVLGPDVELLVDCHWRLDENSSLDVIKTAETLGVGWIECPVPEAIDAIPMIKRLRDLANRRGIRLAGLETSIAWPSMEPFVTGGAYDVVMPDIKYVGGPVEMLRVADHLARNGIAFSPHNPSGPIASAATLHVATVASSFDRLEVQFDETPCFDSLVGHLNPSSDGGMFRSPQGVGLGVTISPDLLERHGSRLFPN